MQGWARDLVSSIDAQGRSRESFWREGPVRALLWQLSYAMDATSHLEVVGCSWEEAVELDKQEWRLDKTCDWRQIQMVRVYAVGRVQWQQPEGASLPFFASQVPPPKGSDARKEFDRCVIAGFDDDWNGIARACCVLRPEEMKKLEFDEMVVEEAEKGMWTQFKKQPKQFIFGGERDGQYERIRQMEEELKPAMERVLNPAGGPAYEGPLSYRPLLVAPAVAVEKIKKGVNVWRLCWNHSVTKLNECLESQECVLPTCDHLIFFLRPDAFWVKMDGVNGFGHFPLGMVLSECFGFERIGTGGYFRRRIADFGSSVAPACAQRFAEAFVRKLASHQIDGVMYSDDLAFMGGTREQAEQKKNQALQLGEKVGYEFDKEDKLMVVQRGVFLGKEIDTTGDGWMRLPEDKVNKYMSDVQRWIETPRGTMQELARLAGRLNFACAVVAGGAAYLVNVYRDLWGDDR